MESYEKLLEEAYSKVKSVPNGRAERFEIPKADAQIIGNKTVISNFSQICSYLRRKPEDTMKFLSKELAAYCKQEGDRLVLNRKISQNYINDKITLYVEMFVICKQCKKPDTEIIKEGSFAFIHCLACGAKHSIGKI